MFGKPKLWIKPVDQTRQATQPNPAFRGIESLEPVLDATGNPPPGGAVLPPGTALVDVARLASGAGLVYGCRNGTTTQPTKAGQYAITANGILSDAYEIRFKPGTLFVV